MTLLNRWLSHLIHACELNQKQHAWHQAKQLAEICPHELAQLPEMLKAEMLSLASTQANRPESPFTAKENSPRCAR